jgi:hypothetical protein
MKYADAIFHRLKTSSTHTSGVIVEFIPLQNVKGFLVTLNLLAYADNIKISTQSHMKSSIEFPGKSLLKCQYLCQDTDRLILHDRILVQHERLPSGTTKVTLQSLLDYRKNRCEEVVASASVEVRSKKQHIYYLQHPVDCSLQQTTINRIDRGFL